MLNMRSVGHILFASSGPARASLIPPVTGAHPVEEALHLAGSVAMSRTFVAKSVTFLTYSGQGNSLDHHIYPACPQLPLILTLQNRHGCIDSYIGWYLMCPLL
jgi:hypothetical protein